MKSVYVVTSGAYSDYRIQAVFSSRKLAQAWIDLHNYQGSWENPNEFNIEPWGVDELKEAEVFDVYSCGIMLETGQIIEQHCVRKLVLPFRGHLLQHSTAVPLYKGAKVSRVESGVSADHARKLAIEARQRWLRDEKVSIGEFEVGRARKGGK